MSNGYLTGCALMISLLIGILFLCKKGVNNIETKIFKNMLLLNFLESFVTTSIVVVAVTINSNEILTILNRLDVVILITWCSLMFYYIYNISESNTSNIAKKIITLINIILI